MAKKTSTSNLGLSGGLVQSAAYMYRSTLPYQPDPVGSFLKSFNKTYDDIQKKKDANYLRVENEFNKYYDKVEVLEEDYNVLTPEQLEIVTPWLRGKKQELFDIKKKMLNASRDERDALRIEMSNILGTVQRSASSMEAMASNLSLLQTAQKNGTISDANGILYPEQTANTLNFAMRKFNDFDQKNGQFIYNFDIYQKAKGFALEYNTRANEYYEDARQSGIGITDTQLNQLKEAYFNNLSENDVVSLLFDNFSFNNNGYFNDETLTDEEKAEYDANFKMLKSGRDTDDYDKAITYFKLKIATKLTDGIKSTTDQGKEDYVTPQPEGGTTSLTAAQMEANREQNRINNLTTQINNLGTFNDSISEQYVTSLNFMYPTNSAGEAASFTYLGNGKIQLTLKEKGSKKTITAESVTKDGTSTYEIDGRNILGSLINLGFNPSYNTLSIKQSQGSNNETPININKQNQYSITDLNGDTIVFDNEKEFTEFMKSNQGQEIQKKLAAETSTIKLIK